MRSNRHPLKVLMRVVSVSLIAPMSAGAAPPEGKGHGNPHKEHKQQKAYKRGEAQAPKPGHGTRSASTPVSIGFDRVRRIALTHRYTGYRSLPPGIRMNLARGKPLPPGIARKTVPGAMLAELPSYPGYEWRIAGTDLVLVAIATAVIADVLFDVFE